MVAAFDYCLHGKGGAAPSIDTAMHGLVDAAHVDHLHPDSGIAIATAADGEALTKEIFGDKVVWVPWRRPGLPARPRHRRDQGGEPAGGRLHPRRPRHHRVGRHQRGVPRRNSLWIIDTAAAYIAEHSKAEPFGPPLDGYAALPEAERRAKAAALAPTIRGIASHGPADGRPLHRLRRGARLPRRRRAPAAGRARHLLPRPLPAHQGQAAGARPARHRVASRSRSPGSRSCTSAYREDYQGYYDRNADAGLARRSAAPTR